MLVVDDDADVRDVIALVLGERHEVRAVDDGADAVRLCAERAPDVIVLDLLVRGSVDGFGVVERLQASGCPSAFVIVSGAQPQDLARAADLPGVSELLPKPFQIDALVGAVERALAR